MMVVRGSVMISGRLVVMLPRRMFRWLSHFRCTPYDWCRLAQVGNRVRNWQG
jgi:hypothetical protein